MHLYKTINGFVVEREDEFRTIQGESSWDDLINRDDLADYLSGQWDSSPPANDFASLLESGLLAPVGSQEVWAAGVTYYSSRLARMEESQDAGGEILQSGLSGREARDLHEGNSGPGRGAECSLQDSQGFRLGTCPSPN